VSASIELSGMLSWSSYMATEARCSPTLEHVGPDLTLVLGNDAVRHWSYRPCQCKLFGHRAAAAHLSPVVSAFQPSVSSADIERGSVVRNCRAGPETIETMR
jgi:hypothetical protein